LCSTDSRDPNMSIYTKNLMLHCNPNAHFSFPCSSVHALPSSGGTETVVSVSSLECFLPYQRCHLKHNEQVCVRWPDCCLYCLSYWLKVIKRFGLLQSLNWATDCLSYWTTFFHIKDSLEIINCKQCHLSIPVYHYVWQASLRCNLLAVCTICRHSNAISVFSSYLEQTLILARPMNIGMACCAGITISVSVNSLQVVGTSIQHESLIIPMQIFQ
jgi:hypothetical protein